MPSNCFILCHPLLLLSILPSIRVFSNESALPSGGKNIRTSASASVLPTNIQGWFPLGSTCLISLLSKGFSRVFSSTSFKGSVLQCSAFFLTYAKIFILWGYHTLSIFYNFVSFNPSMWKSLHFLVCLKILAHHYLQFKTKIQPPTSPSLLWLPGKIKVHLPLLVYFVLHDYGNYFSCFK